jgi:hypothetical protein
MVDISSKLVTSPNASTTTYAHNAADRVTTVTVNGVPHTVTYDANSNLLTGLSVNR